MDGFRQELSSSGCRLQPSSCKRGPRPSCSIKGMNFFTRWATISFTIRTLFYGVSTKLFYPLCRRPLTDSLYWIWKTPNSSFQGNSRTTIWFAFLRNIFTFLHKNCWLNKCNQCTVPHSQCVLIVVIFSIRPQFIECSANSWSSGALTLRQTRLKRQN
jgi:hypothetical protein